MRFSALGTTCKFVKTCNPETNLPRSGIMWSTSQTKPNIFVRSLASLYASEVNSDLERWFMSDYENVTLDNIQKDFSEICDDIRSELLGMAMNELSPAATKHLDY